MVFGMATTKITITLEEDQLDAIREYVGAGKASSVSGFVKHAVGVALFDAAGWQTMLNDALRQTGGRLKKEERAWADALLHDPEEKKAGGKNRAA
jgi:Arc/MetJ-type ribon-helix-helix transcriptional regulator